MLLTEATPNHDVAHCEPEDLDALRIKLLIKEARRLRRRRWYAISLVAAVVAGAIAVGTIGSGSPTLPSGIVNPDGSAFHLAPLTNSQVKTGLLDSLFPTNAHDLAAGWVFADHLQLTRSLNQVSCMSSNGFKSTVVVRKSYLSGDNSVFPNVVGLAKENFQDTTSMQADQFERPIPMGGTTTKAFNLARQHCGSIAFAKVNSLLYADNLMSSWNGTLQSSIEHSSTFALYQAGFASCVQRGGVNVSTIDTYFSYADSRVRASSNVSTTSRRLSALYARCVTPLEQWRDHLRKVDRSRAISSNSEEISNLENSVATYLHS